MAITDMICRSLSLNIMLPEKKNEMWLVYLEIGG